MNCQTVQNQLLILEDPAKPDEAVRIHLRDCAPCQRWQRRLLQLERHVPLLPVPPSLAREAMVQRFLAGIAPTSGTNGIAVNGSAVNQVSAAPILSLESAGTSSHRLIPRYRWYAAIGAAAALFLLIFDMMVLWNPDPAKRDQPPAAAPRDPFLANLFERNLRLAEARNSRTRLEALADLADDLQGQTGKLSQRAEADDLRELARLYEQVVQDGIVRGAIALPAGQRTQVLKGIAERLARTAHDAGILATGAPDTSSAALRAIASAAQTSGDRLRALLGEQP